MTKQLRPANVTILPHQLDSRGRFRLWSVEEKKYIKRFPVDARELLANGSCELKGPAGTSEPEPTNDPNDENGPYNFDQHTVPQLQEMLEELGMDTDEFAGWRKAELIAELEKRDHDPRNQ